jgi:hypothetical protein
MNRKGLKILSSNKRGGGGVGRVPIDRPCLPTQSEVFFMPLKGYSCALNLKKNIYNVQGKDESLSAEVYL